jgi:hypothetical protein
MVVPGNLRKQIPSIFQVVLPGDEVRLNGEHVEYPCGTLDKVTLSEPAPPASPKTN